MLYSHVKINVQEFFWKLTDTKVSESSSSLLFSSFKVNIKIFFYENVYEDCSLC